MTNGSKKRSTKTLLNKAKSRVKFHLQIYKLSRSRRKILLVSKKNKS